MRKQLYSLVFLLLLSQAAMADCKVQNLSIAEEDCIGSNGFFGQAFTACESGTWVSLEFNIGSIQGSGAAHVYIDNGEIANTNSTSRVHVGSFNTMGVKTVPFSYTVNAGQKYIWWVEMTGGMTELCYKVSDSTIGAADDYVHSPRNDESDGTTSNSGSVNTLRGTTASARVGRSAIFYVFIQKNVESIPTMSEWALVIFGLLLLNIGILLIRRKEEILK